MGDQWNKQRELEFAKMQMLMDNFDSDIFLDETGDFKYTNPDVKAVIHCDDVNHLGNAAQNQQHDHLTTVHGFNTEDLIEIQNIKLTEDIPEPSQIQALRNTAEPSQIQALRNTAEPSQIQALRNTAEPSQIQALRNTVSSKTSPTGSQPRNEERTGRPTETHQEHKYRDNNFRGARHQTRQPLQQQGIWQGQGLINRPPPPFQAGYWSPRVPPPQFGNRYQFSAAPPCVNPNVRYGYPHNGAFQTGQAYPRAFNPQTFQRRLRPNAQCFHSTNEFKKY